MTKSRLIQLFGCLILLAVLAQAGTQPADEEKIQACLTRYLPPAMVLEATPDGEDLQLVRCTKPSERLCDIEGSIRAKNYDGVSCLLDAGFDFTPQLIETASEWDPKMLGLLLDDLKTKVNLEAVDELGNTLLLGATQKFSGLIHYRKGHRDIRYGSAELLLAKGANPNAVDRHGMAPLLYSANHGETRFLELLLRYKANPNITSPDGETALMRSDSEEKLRLLLNAGANIYMRDNEGKSAILYAAEACNLEKVKLLIARDPSVLHAVDNEGKGIPDYLKREKACRELRSFLRELEDAAPSSLRH